MSSLIRWLLVVVILVMIVGAVSVVQGQDTDATPLIIGVYGSDNSAAALGLGVAIQEMDAFGPIEGADGDTYRLFGFVSEDLGLLRDATAIMILPDATPPEEEASLAMPLLLIDTEGELAFQNMSGTYFRATTSASYMYQMLAEFAVQGNAAQKIALVGDPERYEEAFADFAAELNANATGGSLMIQNVGSAVPEGSELDSLIEFDPQVLVYRGTMENGDSVYTALADRGWTGVFVYAGAYEARRQGYFFPREGVQLVGLTPWSYGLDDQLSNAFQDSFIERTGQVPTAEAVAAYDTAWAMRLMIQRVGADPAALVQALPTTNPINTTQGEIDVSAYGGDTLYRSVTVYTLLPLGGMDVLARYDNGELVAGGGGQIAAATTPTPAPTATPSQPTVTVTVNVLNVRRGPGFEYNIIGQLRQGQQVTVLGAVADFSWFNVQTPGGIGWVLAEYLQLFNPQGGFNGISVVQNIPPTPTPGATATPTGPPDIVIDNVTLTPAQPVVGQPFDATVTVRNAGVTAAGEFAVAASWEPGGVYSAAIVPSLQPFETTNVVLNATVGGTGTYTVQVVSDLNAQVAESNEGNNNFGVTYTVDAVPLVAQTITLTAPVMTTFAGAMDDLDWTGPSLDTLNGATVGPIPGGKPYDQVTVGDLASANFTNATVTPLAQGTVFGLRTGAGGFCGVFRIDTLAAPSLTLRYRMYSAGDCPP